MYDLSFKTLAVNTLSYFEREGEISGERGVNTAATTSLLEETNKNVHHFLINYMIILLLNQS